MPELPEVEAVCRRLGAGVAGARIAGAAVRRCAPPDIGESVSGRRIHAVVRRGKHILLRLSGGITLLVHLRLSGNLYRIPDRRLPPAAARVRLDLEDGAALVLDDPRALARMEALADEEADARMDLLGPEPLSPAFTPEWLVKSARASRQPAKLYLMDQTRVAGLGNIYAAEALFRARIHPGRVMQRIARPRLEHLHHAIVEVLNDAVQSAIFAYSGPGEFREAETFPLAVYDREGQGCLTCGRKIRRIRQGGRSTYFCPGCQR